MKDHDIVEQLAQTQDLTLTASRAAELWNVVQRLNRVTLSAAMQMGTLGDPAYFDKVLVDCAPSHHGGHHSGDDARSGETDPDRGTTD